MNSPATSCLILRNVWSMVLVPVFVIERIEGCLAMSSWTFSTMSPMPMA